MSRDPENPHQVVHPTGSTVFDGLAPLLGLGDGFLHRTREGVPVDADDYCCLPQQGARPRQYGPDQCPTCGQTTSPSFGADGEEAGEGNDCQACTARWEAWTPDAR